MLLDVNLGPFAPIVGYVGTILAAVYGIWALLWKKKVWETPQDILPKTIRGLLGIILGVGMVFIWLNTDPSNLSIRIRQAIIFVIISVVSFILYYAFLRVLTYDKVVAVSSKKTAIVKVVGGLWLKKNAKENMKRNNLRTVQELFKGAAYDVDELWTRFSQELAKSIIVVFYLAVVTCGTLGLTASGFVVQVKLTNKSASAVIDKTSSPGLEKTK